MKSLLFYVFLLMSFNSFSQKTVNATLITNTNDTLRSNIVVSTKSFDRTLLNELSLQRTLKLKDSRGKHKLKESEIKYLEFVDFQHRKRKFTSKQLIPELKNKNRLYEQMITGKLNWYKSYIKNVYDGSIIIYDHFFLQGQTPKDVGLFNLRKKLKELTAPTRPDLLEKIDKWTCNNIDERNKLIFELITSLNTH
ncbi:MAG TPA: hypothetical protein VF602_10790 [Pedobacter sp.]